MLYVEVMYHFNEQVDLPSSVSNFLKRLSLPNKSSYQKGLTLICSIIITGYPTQILCRWCK